MRILFYNTDKHVFRSQTHSACYDLHLHINKKCKMYLCLLGFIIISTYPLLFTPDFIYFLNSALHNYIHTVLLGKNDGPRKFYGIIKT